MININGSTRIKGPPGFNGTMGDIGPAGSPGYNGTQGLPGPGASSCVYNTNSSAGTLVGSNAKQEVQVIELNVSHRISSVMGTKVFVLV